MKDRAVPLGNRETGTAGWQRERQPQSATFLQWRNRLVERIDDAETRLTQRVSSLETNVNASMDQKMERLETRLLTAFEKWAVPISGRVRKLEVTDGVTEERLAIIEERLRALEKHNPPAA